MWSHSPQGWSSSAVWPAAGGANRHPIRICGALNQKPGAPSWLISAPPKTVILICSLHCYHACNMSSWSASVALNNFELFGLSGDVRGIYYKVPKVSNFILHILVVVMDSSLSTVHVHFIPVIIWGNSLDFQIHYGRRYRSMLDEWEIEWREKLPRFRMWTNEESVHLPDLIITEMISFSLFFSFFLLLFLFLFFPFFPFFFLILLSFFSFFFRRVSRCRQMYTKVLTTGAIHGWRARSKVGSSFIQFGPGLPKSFIHVRSMNHLYSEYLGNIPGIVEECRDLKTSSASAIIIIIKKLRLYNWGIFNANRKLNWFKLWTQKTHWPGSKLGPEAPRNLFGLIRCYRERRIPLYTNSLLLSHLSKKRKKNRETTS